MNQEDALISVFHLLGRGSFQTNDDFYIAFDNHSSYGRVFETFKRHPVYGDCPKIDDIIIQFLIGNILTIDKNGRYEITEKVSGYFGEKIFQELNEYNKKVVHSIVKELIDRKVFEEKKCSL